MAKEKKNILARLLSAGLLLIPLPLGIIFLIYILPKNNEMDYIINILSLAIFIFFTILEIFLLVKNYKKDLMVMSLIYNTNDTINTGGLIINNVILAIGVGLGVWSTITFFTSKNVDIVNATTILIPMCVYVFINTLIYNLYILIFRFKKFDITDLA